MLGVQVHLIGPKGHCIGAQLLVFNGLDTVQSNELGHVDSLVCVLRIVSLASSIFKYLVLFLSA